MHTRSSSARKAGSPSVAKISLIDRPASCSISASASTARQPSFPAITPAAELLPEPMKPIRARLR